MLFSLVFGAEAGKARGDCRLAADCGGACCNGVWQNFRSARDAFRFGGGRLADRYSAAFDKGSREDSAVRGAVQGNFDWHLQAFVVSGVGNRAVFVGESRHCIRKRRIALSGSGASGCVFQRDSRRDSAGRKPILLSSERYRIRKRRVFRRERGHSDLRNSRDCGTCGTQFERFCALRVRFSACRRRLDLLYASPRRIYLALPILAGSFAGSAIAALGIANFAVQTAPGFAFFLIAALLTSREVPMVRRRA